MGKFVQVDGVWLHYVERGSGRPLVLIHGNGAMIEDMEVSGLLDLAARHYRVIAFDRPGFGHSERPRTTVWTPSAQAALIGTALGELDIERPIVLGHSFGALVALALALDHPDVVAGLVLLSGYYFPTARPDVLLAGPPALPVIGDAMGHTVSPLIGRLTLPAVLKFVFAPVPVPHRFAEFPTEMALRPSQIHATAADGVLMVPAAAMLSPRYGELTMPTAILAGDGDKIAFHDRHATKLAETVVGSDLRIVAGEGHMIHWGVPDQVMDAIDGVAARIAPVPASAAA